MQANFGEFGDGAMARRINLNAAKQQAQEDDELLGFSSNFKALRKTLEETSAADEQVIDLNARRKTLVMQQVALNQVPNHMQQFSSISAGSDQFNETAQTVQQPQTTGALEGADGEEEEVDYGDHSLLEDDYVEGGNVIGNEP